MISCCMKFGEVTKDSPFFSVVVWERMDFVNKWIPIFNKANIMQLHWKSVRYNKLVVDMEQIDNMDSKLYYTYKWLVGVDVRVYIQEEIVF